MLKIDLTAARNAWIAEAEGHERERREKSDVLRYRDRDGCTADFHALRHSYITLLERSGVSPKLAQELARHSDIRLTMNVYTHAGLYDLAGAVDSLPSVLGTGSQTLAATGTFGAPGPRLDQTDANSCVSVTPHEVGKANHSQGRRTQETLRIKAVENDCEQVIPHDNKGGRRT